MSYKGYRNLVTKDTVPATREVAKKFWKMYWEEKQATNGRSIPIPPEIIKYMKSKNPKWGSKHKNK